MKNYLSLMVYVFVINGREDFRSRIDATLTPQLYGAEVSYELYYTTGQGDAERYVRIRCDLHPKEEVCFVACGGSGTLVEVASGACGHENKYIAFLKFGATNDFTKVFPDRDFNSVGRIFEGETRQLDIIKAGDSYSLNGVNAGFAASVARYASLYMEGGMEGVKAFKRALLPSLGKGRFQRVRVIADGEALNSDRIELCTIYNGKYAGGQYLCAPNGVPDDGYAEVAVVHCTTIFTFLRMLPHYIKGDYLTDPFCRRFVTYRRAKHVTLESPDLIYLSLDGELTVASHYEIDVLPKAVNFILPCK